MKSQILDNEFDPVGEKMPMKIKPLVVLPAQMYRYGQLFDVVLRSHFDLGCGRSEIK